jgi:hypothetical protein
VRRKPAEAAADPEARSLHEGPDRSTGSLVGVALGLAALGVAASNLGSAADKAGEALDDAVEFPGGMGWAGEDGANRSQWPQGGLHGGPYPIPGSLLQQLNIPTTCYEQACFPTETFAIREDGSFGRAAAWIMNFYHPMECAGDRCKPAWPKGP